MAMVLITMILALSPGRTDEWLSCMPAAWWSERRRRPVFKKMRMPYTEAFDSRRFPQDRAGTASPLPAIRGGRPSETALRGCSASRVALCVGPMPCGSRRLRKRIALVHQLPAYVDHTERVPAHDAASLAQTVRLLG